MLRTRNATTRLLHRSNRILVRSLATETPTTSPEVDSFISQLSRSREGASQFQDLLSQAQTTQDRSRLADRLLSVLGPQSSNADLLHQALQNLKHDQVSPEAINNTISIINTIKSTNVFGTKVPKALSELFLSLCDQGPGIITLLEAAVQQGGSQTSRTILTLCYIRTQQLDKAFKFIQRLSSIGLKIDSSAMELLIIHHCHHEQLIRGAILLKTAMENEYEVYPRTYTELLSKAIQMGHTKVCSQNYKMLISRCYVSNEMIVALAEILATKISCGDMSELIKISSLKESMTPELKARMRISVTENFASGSGYKVAFDYLKETHSTGSMLRVADYPTLLSKFVISKDIERATKTTVVRSYHQHAQALKQFELAMLVAKAVQEGRLSFVLQIFKANSKSLSFLTSADCLNQMIKGLKTTSVQRDFDMFLDVLMASNRTLRTRWAVDSLLKSIVNSDYWFRVFKIFPRVEVEGYKMDKKTQAKFMELLETNGYTGTEHSIPKKFLSE